MIIEAWSFITEEQIKRSFVVCGQGDELVPDEMLCMREGKSCHEGLNKLKNLLCLPAEQRNLGALGQIEMDLDNFIEMDNKDNEDNDPLEI